MFLRIKKEPVDLHGPLRVKAGGGLIKQHDLRLQLQGPGQPHPFLHAAGELSRIFFLMAPQVELLQTPEDLITDLGGSEPGAFPERQGDVVKNSERIEQGRALKQHPEAQTHPVQLPWLHDGDILALHQNAAAVGPHQPQNKLEAHALALAAAPGNHGGPANGNAQIDMVQHPLGAERLHHVNQFNNRFVGHILLSSQPARPPWTKAGGQSTDNPR